MSVGVVEYERRTVPHEILGFAQVVRLQAPNGTGDPEKVTAVVYGEISPENVLIRVHSACYYGEVLGSIDCDCGAQLRSAFEKIRSEGSGILLYMEDQEGRGVGLVNKARAYEVAHQRNLDTVEAFEALGFPLDGRTYGAAARVLEYLGVRSVRLLTNNPRKVNLLAAEGIDVVREPHQTAPTPSNLSYLVTKQEKLGHDLGISVADGVGGSSS